MHELSLINNTHTGNMNPTNYTLIGERQMSSLSPQESFYKLQRRSVISTLAHSDWLSDAEH